MVLLVVVDEFPISIKLSAGVFGDEADEGVGGTDNGQ